MKPETLVIRIAADPKELIRAIDLVSEALVHLQKTGMAVRVDVGEQLATEKTVNDVDHAQVAKDQVTLVQTFAPPKIGNDGSFHFTSQATGNWNPVIGDYAYSTLKAEPSVESLQTQIENQRKTINEVDSELYKVRKDRDELKTQLDMRRDFTAHVKRQREKAWTKVDELEDVVRAQKVQLENANARGDSHFRNSRHHQYRAFIARVMARKALELAHAFKYPDAQEVMENHRREIREFNERVKDAVRKA